MRNARIDRRTFIRHSGAAGLMPLVGRLAPAADELLIRGITGMARACDEPGWFQAHWGAAVLAAHYLRLENGFDDRIGKAVRAQAELMIGTYPSFFVPLKKESPDPSLLGDVERALQGVISGHRAHGHGVTFATLGLRALKDAPDMITPTVARGLRRISERIGRKRPAVDHDYNRQNPLGPYESKEAIAEATFDALLRYEGVNFAEAGTGGPKRPNFTHRITFTDALVQLHRMGYADLAKRGHRPHGIYVNTAPPAGSRNRRKPNPLATVENVLSPEFWESDRNADAWKRKFHVTNNRMGHWIVGHLFKVLYSYLRLRKLIKDEEKVRRVDGIILERYVDPKASGG